MIDSIAHHCIPVSGIFNAHLWESGIGKVLRMRPRDILATNLKSLMEVRSDRSRLPDITEATQGRLTNGTLDRVRRAKVALTLDKLEDLAKAFDLQPWQLLVEGLNPEALPQIADAAFVARLRSILQTADASERKTNPDPPTHQLERQKDSKLSPALKKALKKGTGRNASRKAGGVQKPRTGRRA